MAPLTSADISQQHYACADMIRIACSPTDGKPSSELAMLLEIWEGGGVVQTSFPIAAGSPVAIAVNRQTEVLAEVHSCEPDHDFGYLIDVNIGTPTQWFPRAYVPLWHRPTVDVTNPAELVC